MSQPTLTSTAGGTRPIAEVLTEAFNLYKNNLVAMLITAGIALGPVYLVKNTLVALLLPGVDSSSARLDAQAEKIRAASDRMNERLAAGTATPEELEAYQREVLESAGAGLAEGGGMLMRLLMFAVGILLTIPLLVLANFLAQAALTVLIADRVSGGSLDWQGAWAKTATRLPALFVTSLIVAIGVALGAMMCVLPGLVFGFLCAFVMPVALLEGRSGPEAIKRSIELVKLDWIRVLVVLVVFGVLSYVASAIGSAIVPGVGFLDSLVGDLISVALLPVPIIGLVLLYRELMQQRGEPMQEL